MRWLTCVLSAVCLLALSSPASRADDVKTGLRGVVTLLILPGQPTAKAPEPGPLPGAAVKVYAEGGDKPVAETKTDDKGQFLVSVPVGKYRVEVNAPPGAAKQVAPKAEVKEGEVAEVKVAFVVALR